MTELHLLSDAGKTYFRLSACSGDARSSEVRRDALLTGRQPSRLAHWEIPARKASFLARREVLGSVCEGTALINSM
jgi:hypothetical protein